MAETTKLPRILAIHAHPDDVEFQCAGTLARLKKLGCEISIITMTPGDCGSAELGPVEIAAVRRAEALAAANLVGADFRCLEFRDLQIIIDNEGRRRVAEAIRQTRPEIVLTAPPVDYMSDHEMTSRLVRDACFAASVPNFDTRQLNPASVLPKIPHLYYMDAIEGIDWYGKAIPPEFIIDISDTFTLKRDMLACHASQRDWLFKQHGIDEYLESCQRWSSSRGKEIGKSYGEAFTQHKGHPYPHDNLLLSLLS